MSKVWILEWMECHPSGVCVIDCERTLIYTKEHLAMHDAERLSGTKRYTVNGLGQLEYLKSKSEKIRVWGLDRELARHMHPEYTFPPEEP